jgi:diacylglycerol kinase (ATP)
VQRFSNVEVLKEGSWVPLEVPPEVKAIVLVNLQSYGGGRNIWGPKMTAQSVEKHGWKEPTPNDNMLEVGRAVIVWAVLRLCLLGCTCASMQWGLSVGIPS